MTAEELRQKFEDITGIHWINTSGEPDIDYVMWLEDFCIRNRDAWSLIPKFFTPVEKIVDSDSEEYFEADTDNPPMDKAEIAQRFELE